MPLSLAFSKISSSEGKCMQYWHHFKEQIWPAIKKSVLARWQDICTRWLFVQLSQLCAKHSEKNTQPEFVSPGQVTGFPLVWMIVMLSNSGIL